jgi:hypothetical protein
MGRKHALMISLLLAGCTVAGASAALRTVHLGTAAAKPPHAAGGLIAARKAKLDRFAATLAKARRTAPPPLPHLPKYPAVQIPAAPLLLASAPTSPPQAAPAAATAPKVRYVRPAPIVQTVQAPPAAPPAWSGDDGGGDDGGSGGGD